ncbi:MAG: FAD-dependent monooxygenase [Acidobacteriota bacterium]
MLDVIVAGAGPAGSIAALVLARAGARVLVVDRDAMPRDRLCGDLLNPGAVTLLQSLGLDPAVRQGARMIPAMRVTGPFGGVDADYGPMHGVSLPRRDLDAWLLDEAIQAGARFHPGDIVRRPLMDDSGALLRVRGVVLRSRASHTETRMPANFVIAADGRRSILARQLGLQMSASKSPRWAFGAHVSDVDGMTDASEVHARHGWCLGLTPLADGAVSLWVSVPSPPEGRSPQDVIRRVLSRDRELLARFTRVRFDRGIGVVGPLTVGAHSPGSPGLLLAGDAAGFADPATADGLSLAVQGGRLAALEAMKTLEDGQFAIAIGRLAEARHRAIGRKLQFDRWVRRCVATPAAVDAASIGARMFPAACRRALRYAAEA